MFLVMIAGALLTASHAAPLDFNRDIRPILADNCFECHGPDERARQANLRFDTPEDVLRDEIIMPRKPEASELVRRLISTDPDEIMPPPTAHRKPTAAQIETLKQWVEEGASFAEHWAYLTPRQEPLPEVSDRGWCRTPVDRFVLAKIEADGRQPQKPASPDVLARRLSLALTGLPPTVTELDAFVAEFHRDADQAVSAWVDRLLASESYGEHFASAWLDAARYADTNGYGADGDRSMWRWRDWLIAALNRNVPYDQLTLEMLAGDLLLPPASRRWQSGDVLRDAAAADLLLATGFLRNHRYNASSANILDESRFENATDRLETFGTIWLGTTLQCARCHDHKFDPITSRDYYSLLAFFDKIPEYGAALPSASHPYIHAPTESQRKELAGHEAEVNAAKQALRNAETTISSAQTVWEATLGTPISSSVSTAPLPFDVERVRRGLKHQYLPEVATFDGTQIRTLDDMPNPLITGLGTRWTVSFWFRADGGGDATLFSNVYEPEDVGTGLLADIVGGRLRLRHVLRWVQSRVEFVSREPVRPGEWYHVTFSSDGRGQGVAYRATLNGNPSALQLTEGAPSELIDSALGAKFIVGGGPFLPKFKGALADLRFYDRNLTDLETAFLAECRRMSELAAVPLAQRTASEHAFLRMHFLESAAPPSLKALQEAIVTAEVAQATFIRALPTVMVMQQVTGHQTHHHTSGAYDKLGDPVSPGTPATLPQPADARLDRVQLAQWLMRADHPLTARVAVNRLWQQLWGSGFVQTPENFGTQCAQPVHHELLDWLAVEYRRLGWDTKALLKLVVTSAVYRQNSGAPADLWAVDPGNRLLARGPRFRLPVGAVRDSALAISGLLQRDLGGPPVLLEPIKGKNGRDAKLNPYRRTVYTFWKRNAPHPMLAVFDVADRNQCDVRPRRTNTPLQALVGLNEPVQVACAQAFARRILTAANDTDSRLVWAFRYTTGRAPNEAELILLRDAIAAYRQQNAHETDAWSTLGNVLLNLDAALTLE